MRKIILTAKQARKADETTINKYGIPCAVLMERAGNAVAEEALLAARSLKKIKSRPAITVFCGRGNNGGDGMVCARYLSSAGVGVRVFLLCRKKELKGDAFNSMLALDKRKIGLREIAGRKGFNCLKKPFYADIIIDAIFGTGFYGRPDIFYEDAIKSINMSRAYKISIDVPSGLDATTGTAQGAVVAADLTVTMGFAKTGFYKNKGPFYCGAIKVADIGLMRQGKTKDSL